MNPFESTTKFYITKWKLVMQIITKLSLITLCLSATLAAPISAKDVTIYYTNDLHAHVSREKSPPLIKTEP